MPLAYLHVCGAQATLIVKAHEVDAAALDGLVLDGLRSDRLEGLWLHLHPAAGRRLFARSGWRLAWGVPRSTDAHGLQHGPTAFAQALPELHDTALRVAVAHLRPSPGTSVLDLYCGYGASLREWTARGQRGARASSCRAKRWQLAAVNAPAAQVLRGTCVQRLPQIRDWWQAQARLPRRLREPAALRPRGRGGGCAGR